MWGEIWPKSEAVTRRGWEVMADGVSVLARMRFFYPPSRDASGVATRRVACSLRSLLPSFRSKPLGRLLLYGLLSTFHLLFGVSTYADALILSSPRADPCRVEIQGEFLGCNFVGVILGTGLSSSLLSPFHPKQDQW